MSEGGEPSAPATPGLLLLSYTTPRDAAPRCRRGRSCQRWPIKGSTSAPSPVFTGSCTRPGSANGAEVESAEIAAELVQLACLKERYCRPRGFGSRQSHQQPLILHADNGNAMRAATLESRLEELGVLRSFSRPRVSNDNPYSESLFRTVKFRPDYPSRPFASKAEACEWVAAFVDWYNHRHRHSGIKFVTPHQRHSGAAIAICQERTQVYEKARQAHPKRWSQSTRCWRQPVVVWINKPPEGQESNQALPLIQAA